MRNFLIFASSLILLSACGSKTLVNQPKSADLSIFEHALKDTLGLIRGADLGEEYEVVEQLEYDSALVVKSKFNLVYDYNLGEDNSINVKYIFAGTSVRLIELNLLLTSEIMADSVATDFINYYSKRFGTPAQQMGVYVWKTETMLPNSDAYIELKDESAEYGFGKLNITIFPRPSKKSEA